MVLPMPPATSAAASAASLSIPCSFPSLAEAEVKPPLLLTPSQETVSTLCFLRDSTASFVTSQVKYRNLDQVVDGVFILIFCMGLQFKDARFCLRMWTFFSAISEIFF